MSACCSGGCSSGKATVDPRFRKALWVALIINALMFVVELVGGLRSGSVSLLADAVDFAGDAANYALSLAVLSMGMMWRARAALVKGLSMGGYGVFVLGKAAWALASGVPPEPITMAAVALLALFPMIFAMSRYLCSRNDAIVNVAVGLAALGVMGSGTAWPDVLVAVAIAALALSAAWSVVRQARGEIAAHAAVATPM